MHEFDEGPKGVFRKLCQEYPGDDVYTTGFRTKWGPISNTKISEAAAIGRFCDEAKLTA